MYANFGQRPFTYPPPAGYKSFCTKNIPPNVPSLVRPKRHFDTLLWTGTGSSNIVEWLEFSPDLAWVKVRNNTGDYLLIDQIRGGDQYVYSNNNDAEALKGLHQSYLDLKNFIDTNLKKYKLDADDLLDVIETGGRRYSLAIMAAMKGNRRALRQLDDLLGFL